MTETITGVSEEQLTALTAGRWVDDDTNTPGWERWMTVIDEDGERWRVRQWVFPAYIRNGWHVIAETEDKDEEERLAGQTDTLEEALMLCDNWADSNEIERPSVSATLQEHRFTEWATSNLT